MFKVLLAASLIIGLNIPAKAQVPQEWRNRNFSVANGNSQVITEVSIREGEDNPWSRNFLHRKPPVEPYETRGINIPDQYLSPSCYFDVKVVYADSSYDIVDEVAVCAQYPDVSMLEFVGNGGDYHD